MIFFHTNHTCIIFFIDIRKYGGRIAYKEEEVSTYNLKIIILHLKNKILNTVLN